MINNKLTGLIAGIVILLIVSCNSYKHVQYETIYKGKEKTLKGVLNRQVIESDTAFGWFKENMKWGTIDDATINTCLLYTSPSPRDRQKSRMPSSA